MHKCTIEEVRHVHCENLKFKCVTPLTSANGGGYAHIIELFMVVDFPNGHKTMDVNNGIFFKGLIVLNDPFKHFLIILSIIVPLVV